MHPSGLGISFITRFFTTLDMTEIIDFFFVIQRVMEKSSQEVLSLQLQSTQDL